jgi:hypothetical protein
VCVQFTLSFPSNPSNACIDDDLDSLWDMSRATSCHRGGAISTIGMPAVGVSTGHPITDGTRHGIITNTIFLMRPTWPIHTRIVFVIPNVQAELLKLDVAVAPDQERAEDGLGEEVKNTVEYSFAVRRNDITTLTDTPCDRVDDPEDGCQRATKKEAAGDLCAEEPGVTA